MSEQANRTTFTTRDFVSAVRVELAAIGREDVRMERSWIDEDEPGYPFLVRVPVTAELRVPLMLTDGGLNARTTDDLKWHAGEFAKALVNLDRARAMLGKYARDVHRAAVKVISAAQAEGLDLLLDRVGFKPVYANHLAGRNWKEAAHHVLAAVAVRHTEFHLRPDTSEFWVEEPEDVAVELEQLIEEQRERQIMLADLEAQGADLIVDGITLDILAAHGLDVEDTLRRVWKQQCLNLSVEHGGRQATLSLGTSEGAVTASIELSVTDLSSAVWNGEHLWFTGPEQTIDRADLVGKCLGELVPHPAFASRPITSVAARHGDLISFDLSDKLRFDADTGRIWREERVAA